MKILVVDDSPRRYETLVSKMDEVGVPRDHVTLVTNAHDARDRLEADSFDLMILDILIPLRAEGEPSERHSLDLLDELIDFGEDLKRPRQIVGLSGSDEAAASATPFFSDNLWTIVRYREASDDWIAQIQNCIRYIASASTGELTALQADLVVICALDDPELRAVLELPWEWQAAKPIDEVTFVHEGRITAGDAHFTVVAAAANRIGMVPAALLTAKLVDRAKPRLVAMTGICAGIRGKVKIGDVLVADPTWDWQSGKRTRVDGEPGFSISPHQLPLDSATRSHFEQLRADRQAFADIAASLEDAVLLPKVVICPVASGSAVLADGTIAEGIRTQHRDLGGIEMEAYGVYAAVALAGPPRPSVLSAKAVCDFADEEKSDNHQRVAAQISAKTLELYISRFGRQVLRNS